MSTLRVLREINNYTQQYIAEYIGVDQSTYSKLERNPRNLLAEQAQKLANLYKVDLSDIISSGVSILFQRKSENKDTIHNLDEEPMGKISAAKDEEIKLLKEEVEYLRTQNLKLLSLIEKKS